MADLVLLSADVDIEASMTAILQRPQSLGIRPIEVELLRHPGHDPGVFKSAREVLRPYAGTSEKALAVLDCAWDGNHLATAIEVEDEVRHKLAEDWGDGAEAIAIDPEVEMWIWSSSPHVADSIAWNGDTAALRKWLAERDLWKDSDLKRDLSG